MKTQDQIDHCDKTKKEDSWLIPHCMPELKETGTYENLSVEERLCYFCNCVEDEIHVMLVCNVHDDIRTVLLENALVV